MTKVPAPEANSDFSCDEAYGQLSRAQILAETVYELVDSIPEIAKLAKARRDEIEKMFVEFADTCYKQGFEKGQDEAV
jgi:hypothetical protein